MKLLAIFIVMAALESTHAAATESCKAKYIEKEPKASIQITCPYSESVVSYRLDNNDKTLCEFEKEDDDMMKKSDCPVDGDIEEDLYVITAPVPSGSKISFFLE